MKIVIIGGGIAGLTLGRFLLKKKFDVTINERAKGAPLLGHAFLMHEDGLAIMQELSDENGTKLPGEPINTFSLKRPDGKEIKKVQLDSWHCIKRRDMITYLLSLIPADRIKGGRAFSHFIYEGEKIVAAVFLNGEVEYGDVFVGADGGNSKVRELIHGKISFTPVEVKEIVGVCQNERLAKIKMGKFTKFQNKEKGLAFGMIPTGNEEFVWFMQYDPSILDVPDASPEELKEFCSKMLEDFPSVVHELLGSNDFNTTYIWNTRDFDLLPLFHKKNVVLIGDAAHLALPFTSAGTTNAILDAKIIAEAIIGTGGHEPAFQKYYELRSFQVSQHIILGRELKKIFLKPLENDDNIPVPLIAQETNNEIIAKGKPIQVMYFTDPICSTCWIIQPLLRKLKLEYDKYINIEYRMGGLLPTWENFDKGGIKSPTDAAKHWEAVCALHEMPLDGDVWIEDPLPSSFPPSIAFKAAQMQNNDKAILFLRRIKEMVFLEKKNIIKWEFLEKSAFDVGLDSARLLRDIEGKAKDLFIEDLELANKREVTGFPTLFFSGQKNDTPFTIKGYQPYEEFEKIVFELVPDAKKEIVNTDPKNLFTHFERMTEKEFCFLSNISKAEGGKILDELFSNGNIDKYESKSGTMYISNFL